MAKTKVFYIPGRFVHERLEDHEVDSAEEAHRLVATGAFALSASEANKQANAGQEPTAADASNVKKAPQPEPEPSSEE